MRCYLRVFFLISYISPPFLGWKILVCLDWNHFSLVLFNVSSLAICNTQLPPFVVIRAPPCSCLLELLPMERKIFRESSFPSQRMDNECWICNSMLMLPLLYTGASLFLQMSAFSLYGTLPHLDSTYLIYLRISRQID